MSESRAGMDTARDRILEGVAQGRIDPVEGKKLLDQLPSSRRWWSRWLLNPVEPLVPRSAWIVGALVCAASLGLTRFSIRFDGAVDLHIVEVRVPLWVGVLDQLAAWPLVALTFWGVAKLLGSAAPPERYLAYLGAARAPLTIGAALVGFMVFNTEAVERWTGFPAASLLVIVALPSLAWFIVALLSAVRVASGLAGLKLVGLFVFGLVAAEGLGELALNASFWALRWITS